MNSVLLEPLHTYALKGAYKGVYAELDAFVQDDPCIQTQNEWFSEESRSIERDTKGLLLQFYRIVRQQDLLFKMLAVLFSLQSIGIYFCFQ
ncbi:MAG: hypothetical protein LW809_01175 [Vampirovibrionales bacterium]|jgi:hypothetical protein|nr:hypothetical protein [Vampirovibrionales bacterium]